MSKQLAFGSIILLLSFLFSCVPAKRYQEVVAQRDSLDRAHRGSLRIADSLRIGNKELRGDNTRLAWQVKQLIRDSLEREGTLARTRDELADLKYSYGQLEANQRAIVEGNQRETSKMLTEMQRMQGELLQRERAVKGLEEQLYQRRQELDRVERQQENSRKTLDSLRAGIEAMASALSAKHEALEKLQQALARKDSASAALKDRIARALFGFEGRGLTVHEKGGRVHISIEDKLLFKSGSYDIDRQGVEAIKQLVPILEQYPDLNIVVEGHTDDVPMKGVGPIADNWDLSAKRATTIVKLLLEGTSIPPHNISAAGRAEFHPIDQTKTAEARQKNRRTEIILTPNLNEIMDLLN